MKKPPAGSQARAAEGAAHRTRRGKNAYSVLDYKMLK